MTKHKLKGRAANAALNSNHRRAVESTTASAGPISPSLFQQVPNLLGSHPLATVFPLMEGPQFDELVADIRAHGVRQPVILYQNKVLDGRSRARAAEIAGVPCPTRTYEGNDPVAFVISANLHRRHLNESQRAMVAADIATMRQGRRTDISSKDERSQQQAAALLKVSPSSVGRAVTVRNEGVPELAQAVWDGRVRVEPASCYARLPKAEQRKIVAELSDPVVNAEFKKRKKQRRDDNRRKIAEIAAQPVMLPPGQFETFVIDYPWEKERGGVPDDGVGWPYPCMTLDQIKTHAREIVRPRAADNAHCFIWATQSDLPDAFDVLKECGFEYGDFTMVWLKGSGPQPDGTLKSCGPQPNGKPCYNNEFVVYGRRGSPQLFTSGQHFKTCFYAEPREQCRKPDEFYDVIRRVTRGPRIDMFSREKREGFEQHGHADEINKFEEAAE